MNTGFRSDKKARNPYREQRLNLRPRQNRFGDGRLPPFFHRPGVGFAVHENLLDFRMAGRGHDGLHGEFASRIARAFSNVKAFQAVGDLDLFGVQPTPYNLTPQQNFIRRGRKYIGAGTTAFPDLVCSLRKCDENLLGRKGEG
jgi:hypothetical protein